jgi:hypothetical protein
MRIAECGMGICCIFVLRPLLAVLIDDKAIANLFHFVANSLSLLESLSIGSIQKSDSSVSSSTVPF